MLLRVEIVVTEAKVDDDMDPAGAIRKPILIPTHVAGLNFRLIRELAKTFRSLNNSKINQSKF